MSRIRTGTVFVLALAGAACNGDPGASDPPAGGFVVPPNGATDVVPSLPSKAPSAAPVAVAPTATPMSDGSIPVPPGLILPVSPATGAADPGASNPLSPVTGSGGGGGGSQDAAASGDSTPTPVATDASASAASQPSPSPTDTSSPTPTPTDTPTPTPEPSPTSTPTPAPSPTHSATPHPSSAPVTVGVGLPGTGALVCPPISPASGGGTTCYPGGTNFATGNVVVHIGAGGVYTPSHIYVRPGATTTFMNTDKQPHNLVGVGGGNVYNSGTIQPGASVTRSWSLVGTWQFHDTMVKNGATFQATDVPAK